MRTLRTIADHKSFLQSNLTNFQQAISLNIFITSKKFTLIKIQAYVLAFKIYLVHLTHNCSLRIEKHAFVNVELADFCCVVSRKIFQRDSVLKCVLQKKSPKKFYVHPLPVVIWICLHFKILPALGRRSERSVLCWKFKYRVSHSALVILSWLF